MAALVLELLWPLFAMVADFRRRWYSYGLYSRDYVQVSFYLYAYYKQSNNTHTVHPVSYAIVRAETNMQNEPNETDRESEQPMRWDEEDRAVSPVVGVALLIAITAILAAVVGSVIFGLSVDGADSPETTVSFSANTDTVELVHEGGETLDPDTIVIRYDGHELALDGELSAGQSQVIIDTTAGDPNFENADRITVVWQDPRSNAENILGTFRP